MVLSSKLLLLELKFPLKKTRLKTKFDFIFKIIHQYYPTFVFQKRNHLFMKKFKERWEIQEDWQLVFPLIGLLLLSYCSYKLAGLLTNDFSMGITLITTIPIAFLLLKGCLSLFKKLEKKWTVTHKWELIRIFIVFTLTGSSSVFIGRPIIKLMGITPTNLGVFYWFFNIALCIIFYQILLVVFGWLLGQFAFFWEFEKKMLRRFGLGRLLNVR